MNKEIVTFCKEAVLNFIHLESSIPYQKTSFCPSEIYMSFAIPPQTLNDSLEIRKGLWCTIHKCPFAVFSDRLIGLPEGRARNHNRPQQIPVLAGVVIEDVAVGAEHTLALASTGDVYAWGSNSEGQVNIYFTVALSCLEI